MSRVDILNLEWETNSRDTNIIDPILYSLRKRYGFTIKCSSIWYSLIKLLWYRPKVLLISNDTGARVNVDAFRFAKMLGIKCATLISEGLHYQSLDPANQKAFNTELYWGNNTRHEIIWDLKLFWSEALRDEMYRDVEGTRGHNIKVSGASGFDKYTLMSNDEIRDGFGDEYKNKYKKIVLIVGLGFDCLIQSIKSGQVMGLDENEIKNRYNMRKPVKAIYEQLIISNPDMLFILKHHPGSTDFDDTEFGGLEKLENTVVYHRGVDIAKLVCLSDLIIAFESTVCMEAWLMGKETILVNPSGTAFTRSNLHNGSVIAEDYDQLQELVFEYFSLGTIKAFDELKDKREEIIADQIQFRDGANYLRCAKLIDDFVKGGKGLNSGIHTHRAWMLFAEIVKELKGWLVEYTPIGRIKTKARKARRQHSEMYDKATRKKEIMKFGKTISRFEKEHRELVNDICLNYKG